MAKEPIELPDGDGAYMRINMIARRAREINKQRHNSDIYDDNQPDPVDMAINEYENGMLKYEFRHHLLGTEGDYRSNQND